MTPAVRPTRAVRFAGKDRRSANRYSIKTELEYCVTTGRRDVAWKRGLTINISVRAVLVNIAEVLEPGTMLTVRMDWSGLYHGRRMVRLLLSCQVVRVDAHGTLLRIVEHDFRDPDPGRNREGRIQKGH